MALITIADPELGELDEIVDTDRYRLGDLESSAALGVEVAARLRREGAVTLPGFLRPEALAAVAADLEAASRHVPIRRHRASVYHRSDLEARLEPDDPRCASQEWLAGHVTRDMIPAYSPAAQLYVSPYFKRFIAACVGQTRVFEYADPIAGLVATVLPPGGTYPWHYDTNEYVVTIMVREPESGGHFEFCKDLRSPGDENLDGLGRVLSGADPESIRTTSVGEGDLQLFLGRYSLHRVTPVIGDRARHVLVLSFADRPGVIGPLDRTRSVYGRVTEAHLVASEASAVAPDGLVL
ncbi:MAG: hypothetical protein AAF567_03860 [Actinomycetota bacterium]